mgnify:CR=1 FL=1
MKKFISVHDVTDLSALVADALRYKANPHADKTLGSGKRIGLLFLNPSLRTRLSSQVAAQNLGMEAIVFNVGQEGWALEFEEEAIMSGNTVEHIKDAARVLSLYFDVLAIRTFPSLKNREDDYSELFINQVIKYAGIPVISLESATLHPLQSFADLITIQETWKQPKKPKVVLTWAPHVKPLPQCVANSFSQWMTTWGECSASARGSRLSPPPVVSPLILAFTTECPYPWSFRRCWSNCTQPWATSMLYPALRLSPSTST